MFETSIEMSFTVNAFEQTSINVAAAERHGIDFVFLL